LKTVDITDVLCGNANNPTDQVVNIVAALWVARFVAGLNPSPFDPVSADVHRPTNGVGIVDALLIARQAANLPPTAGICWSQP
jgi:hypothetical protein